ncbi:PREDICTED: uncharacterized protein LOC105562550 isoform X1 [Vollenhovia emeryi]|uniref:uncharacterized protein LOC105562550 isoform X1 n=1 Tax=Vollenhovia emeryi TaxID=411798 RepID=UPI0005F4D2A9|nr:PREDICTED: uncharacterized protein LOC105562550 isoform X1 [Vollenhovia emeryi]
MLDCLTSDEDEIKSELGLSIDISKYDVTALCLRKVKSLLEEQVAFANGVAAVLKKLRKLQPSDQYAHGAVIKRTCELEIESTTFALCAPKLRGLVENKSPNVVPAYTMINVKKDTNLKLYLQNCLKKWKQLFSRYFKKIVKDWEPKLILCMLITAGEHARLYRYEDCEAEIWTYKLALEINDHTVIYITSRCISLR